MKKIRVKLNKPRCFYGRFLCVLFLIFGIVWFYSYFIDEYNQPRLQQGIEMERQDDYKKYIENAQYCAIRVVSFSGRSRYRSMTTRTNDLLSMLDDNNHEILDVTNYIHSRSGTMIITHRLLDVYGCD